MTSAYHDVMVTTSKVSNSYCRKFYVAIFFVAKHNYIQQAKELREKLFTEQDEARQPDQVNNKRLRKAGI